MRFLTKDQNLADETTVYWFDVDGEEFGVSDCNGEKTVVDCDGCPVNLGDAKNAHIKYLHENVTDEMIAA